MSRGPLAGVRVADFTQLLAGPYCTQLLADAGATVIKIEAPTGEASRIRGPKRYLSDGRDFTSYLAAVNRGKQSVVLDLKNEVGRALARRLVATCDIAVENFAPGTLTKLGIDYSDLRERDPRLITVSFSLYGKAANDGMLARRGGLAVVAEGESSVTSMSRDGQGRPVQLGFPLGDMAAGMTGYGAVTTALFDRERSGRGTHIDISLAHVLLSFNSCGITTAQLTGTQQHAVRTAGYGVYRALDGYIALGINNDSLFRRTAEAMGMSHMADDPRYAGTAGRDQPENADAVDAAILEWVGARTVDEVIDVITATGVPCGRIATPGDVLASPEFRSLGFFETIPDGDGGTIDVPSNPLHLRQEHYDLPYLGRDTRAVLRELGVDDAERDRLAAEGAFGGAHGTAVFEGPRSA